MISGKAKCGLRYAVKRCGSTVGYCSLSTKCGTRVENGYHNGIAHFTEHTIFKGTAHKSAFVINSYLERLGGELNAYTTKEEIVLHATVLKEDLSKAGSLLMELATCPTFPEDEIRTEQSVVIDEIKSYKDSPSDDVYDRFEERIFANHPLGKPILGSIASVRKITSEELRRFVKDKFVPENMAFTVVADLDEKVLEKLVLRLADKFFGSEASAVGKDASPKLVKLVQPDSFDVTIDKHNHEVNAVIGGIAPSMYEEKDRFTTILMCNILGGPAANSILNEVLREKNGWVYGVECSYNQYSDTGLVTICLGCDKVNLEKCFSSIRKEIRKLKEVPLSEAKMKAGKKQLLGQLAILNDNGETQCLNMGHGLLSFNRAASDEEISEKIEAVTAQDIQEICQKIFDDEKMSRLIFL